MNVHASSRIHVVDCKPAVTDPEVCLGMDERLDAATVRQNAIGRGIKPLTQFWPGNGPYADPAIAGSVTWDSGDRKELLLARDVEHAVRRDGRPVSEVGKAAD